ncbi:sensor histidine kinase [Paenibacillus silviterrae]|uniref:sensor histidine kinase n=1 Tax=Paenibacillus silviterrae TaxID=3242194 RepID=UPI002542E8F7|nr:ATP-binding protein [Paenibacillus chinjuensis]
MKMRLKLFFTFWAFGIVIFLLSNQRMTRLTVGNDGIETTITVLLLGVSAIAGVSYLLAITLCLRLEILAGQTKNAVRQHPGLPSGLERSQDEIAMLTYTVNLLKEQLTEGESIRNQLVADIAHELRTPLAILRGHLETILEGAEEFDRAHLIPLLDETKRMSRLIQDMQDLNLAEAGKLALDRTWSLFRSTLEEIVSILEIAAEAKSITLHLDGGGDGELYMDASRIKQVFINLIGNAVRYTPEGGRIDVHYSYQHGQVIVTVSDNGPGIPPESLPYIFKRFYRVENSRNRMSGGTGIGLAIAKEFIEVHGGTIHVESEPGVGTSFTVTLPVFPPNP